MTVATSHSMLFAEAIRPLLDVAYRVAEQLTDTSQQAEECLVEAAMVGPGAAGGRSRCPGRSLVHGIGREDLWGAQPSLGDAASAGGR